LPALIFRDGARRLNPTVSPAVLAELITLKRRAQTWNIAAGKIGIKPRGDGIYGRLNSFIFLLQRRSSAFLMNGGTAIKRRLHAAKRFFNPILSRRYAVYLARWNKRRTFVFERRNIRFYAI